MRCSSRSNHSTRNDQQTAAVAFQPADTSITCVSRTIRQVEILTVVHIATTLRSSRSNHSTRDDQQTSPVSFTPATTSITSLYLSIRLEEIRAVLRFTNTYTYIFETTCRTRRCG